MFKPTKAERRQASILRAIVRQELANALAPPHKPKTIWQRAGTLSLWLVGAISALVVSVNAAYWAALVWFPPKVTVAVFRDLEIYDGCVVQQIYIKNSLPIDGLDLRVQFPRTLEDVVLTTGSPSTFGGGKAHVVGGGPTYSRPELSQGPQRINGPPIEFCQIQGGPWANDTDARASISNGTVTIRAGRLGFLSPLWVSVSMYTKPRWPLAPDEAPLDDYSEGSYRYTAFGAAVERKLTVGYGKMVPK